MVMPVTPEVGQQRSACGRCACGRCAGGGHVWLLPLREPSIDAQGHLRLGFWSGNEKLKGASLDIVATLKPAAGADVAWIDGSETWDHATGVVVSGTLHTGASSQIGFALETSKPPPPPEPGPDDAGPSKGWDRGGNDYNCFAVNSSFTAADCAAACAMDAKCMAWTTIGVLSAGAGAGAGAGAAASDLTELPAAAEMERPEIACDHGKPLTSRYCTLKAPTPTTIHPSPTAFTGLPARALHKGHKPANDTSPAVTTSMLMDVKPDTDPSRSTRVYDTTQGSAAPPKLRDTTGPFPCGASSNAPVTCMRERMAVRFPLLRGWRLQSR